MNKHWKDYFWKEGRPNGKGALDPENIQGTSYKIVADPYFKRISIEKYLDGHFVASIYDSALFNFRHLKPAEQAAWQKKVVSEEQERMVCHIYNQDDRLILIEEYLFDNHLCRECRSFSPQRVPISVQKIFYTALSDPFNGAILYDMEGKIVLSKRYEVDENGTFTTLIEEKWDNNQWAGWMDSWSPQISNRARRLSKVGFPFLDRVR